MNAFLLAAALLQAPLYDESFAVVVGIDSYQSPDWPTLSYAVKDAEAVARYLSANGFQVIELYDRDATKQAILTAMQNNVARRAGEGDRVLIFFAGHGYTETLARRDWGYVIPYDGASGSASFISMEELRTQSQKMGDATHQLFIMDSCYGGSLGTRGVAPLSPDLPDYLREVTRRPARQFLTAGGKGQQVADGGPKGHSYFTGYLLEALEDGLADLNGDRYITFSELSAYLVPRATSDLQTPATGNLPEHGLGEFTFGFSAERPRAESSKRPSPRRPPEPEVEDSGPRTAERLAADYIGALLSMDVDAILALVDIPFYFDGEIFVRREDWANQFRTMFSVRINPGDLKIQGIRAESVGEFPGRGYRNRVELAMQSMDLQDRDYVITVSLPSEDEFIREEFLLFAKVTPAGLRIVGSWG